MAANKSPARQRYNKLAKQLKNLLHNLKNEGIQDYLKGLTPTEVTEYSLWKATRKKKRPQHHISPIRKKQQHLGQNEQTKSHGFCRTFRIGLSALSVPTVGNGRRNH